MAQARVVPLDAEFAIILNKHSPNAPGYKVLSITPRLDEQRNLKYELNVSHPLVGGFMLTIPELDLVAFQNEPQVTRMLAFINLKQQLKTAFSNRDPEYDTVAYRDDVISGKKFHFSHSTVQTFSIRISDLTHLDSALTMVNKIVALADMLKAAHKEFLLTNKPSYLPQKEPGWSLSSKENYVWVQLHSKPLSLSQELASYELDLESLSYDPLKLNLNEAFKVNAEDGGLTLNYQPIADQVKAHIAEHQRFLAKNGALTQEKRDAMATTQSGMDDFGTHMSQGLMNAAEFKLLTTPFIQAAIQPPAPVADAAAAMPPPPARPVEPPPIVHHAKKARVAVAEQPIAASAPARINSIAANPSSMFCNKDTPSDAAAANGAQPSQGKKRR